MKSDIHIVTDGPGTLREIYLIARLSSLWQSWGHRVTVGRTNHIVDGLGIMHIDLTRISAADLPETERPLLNRKVLDTSKHLYSSLRVYPKDSWDGPVILKSTLNFFGTPERTRHRPGFFERQRRKLARRSWNLARILPTEDYPVLPGISAVPGWAWKREDLIVERFLPEKEGDLYSIRGWLFFGHRGFAYRLFSKSPIVKTRNITHYEFLDHVPPELESVRQAHGFDFGKFDYVEVDGRAVVFDMNKTPTTMSNPGSPRLLDLAEGIYGFQGMHVT